MNLEKNLNVGMVGHVLIKDVATGEVLVNKRNAIHKENASIVLAAAFANRSTDGGIYSMVFGTGGAWIDSVGSVQYLSPNDTGNADLHSPIYTKIVDDNSGASAGNGISVRHVSGNNYTDVETRCLLSLTEPPSQLTVDNASNADINNTTYAIDEIGLKSNTGRLICHVTFAPVIKSANRELEIIYTIRVTVN